MRQRSILLIAVMVCAALLYAGMQSGLGAETFGVKKRRVKPHEYGNITIKNYTYSKGTAPVLFKHWVHRSQYTCRVCHVDVGFAMEAGQTNITCDDIQNGLYCGACHNNDTAFGREGKGPDGSMAQNCDRCHSVGKDVAFKKDFYQFRARFRKERFGNGIDWLHAEKNNLVNLKDEIPGLSIPRRKLQDPDSITLHPYAPGMPDILFSHEKHAVWNGCELCHPEIFGVKTGATKYGMQDIFDGKFCGACHDKVAFPNDDCQRCHTKEVF